MRYFAAVVLGVLLYMSLASAGDVKVPSIGQEAPAFSLKSYEGKVLDLASLLKSNKLIVVMFISTQCPVSNGYNERMEQLYETYSKRGVAVVGINSNKAESIEEIASHAKEHGFKFPVLKDERNIVADLYGAQVTPETYVITKEKKLAYHGRIDDSRKLDQVKVRDLSVALDALLAGKTPPRTEAKAVGCSIKRLE